MEVKTVRFIRLNTSENKIFIEAMELYKKSFPIHEQRSLISQKKILNNEEYHFNLIYDGDIWVGMILFWETQDFIYVEHFCINPEMRNKKYGQRALELLNKFEKAVILEIDPPIDEISNRRKAFYERLQYKANVYVHIHPPYGLDNKGHTLVVMSHPTMLSKVDYESFYDYLEITVMKAF